MNLSDHLAIRRRAQARAPFRMHSLGAYAMHFHTVILQNCHLKIWRSYINKLAQNFDSFSYIFNMECLFCLQSPIDYVMLCHAMPCYVMPCTMPCAMCCTGPSSAGNLKLRTALPVRDNGNCRGSADS